MFNHIGWGELVVLAIIGLIVFGPDRLPKAAADLARLMRQLRGMAQNATADLKAELGPEMADLDLTSLHPRRIMQSVWDDDDAVSRSPSTRTLPPLAAGERPPYDSDAT